MGKMGLMMSLGKSGGIDTGRRETTFEGTRFRESSSKMRKYTLKARRRSRAYSDRNKSLK